MTSHAILSNRSWQRALLVLTLLSVAAMPRSAAALPVGLELEIGTGVPFGPFPDGVPVSVDDAAGKLFAKIPQSAYNILLDAKPRAGFSTALALLLGNWYLRAAVSINTYSTVSMSRYAFRRIGGQDVPAEVQNIYVGKIDQEIELPDSTTFVTARFGFGRRWYLLFDKPVRPYLLMGIGGVVASLEDGTRGGLTFHGGIGADVHIHQRLDLGLKVVYEWTGLFLPENFQATSATTAIGTAATSENTVLEAFVESLHLIQIGVTATYRF